MSFKDTKRENIAEIADFKKAMELHKSGEFAKVSEPMVAAGVTVEPLKARGAFRDPGDERSLFVAFNRKPSDDELRAVHDCLSKVPATCPFCAKPTYLLPCSHCGEPDLPEGF